MNVGKNKLPFEVVLNTITYKSPLGGYHIFQEPDGFVYDIQMVRIVRTTNQIERYSLKVSHRS